MVSVAFIILLTTIDYHHTSLLRFLPAPIKKKVHVFDSKEKANPVLKKKMAPA